VPLDGEYEPSPSRVVREQVALYERTGGREGNVGAESGLPIVIVTTRGRRSGKLRKVPVMRIEHAGVYAMVASNDGASRHPVWYYNVLDDPAVTVQDGPEPFDGRARELRGAEREEWWQRAVAAYPAYAQYQAGIDRQIPVVVIEPA
jgi:deazaflavin-dependent oxidoreductase (nitroreductase family)